MQENGADLNALIPAVYEQLRVLAHQRLRAAPGEHSLNTTGLVHEAYLRLANSQFQDFVNRDHFLAIASRVMRNVLVDNARMRASEKRGAGTQAVSLAESDAPVEVDLDSVLELDEALRKLSTIDRRQSDIVECRYFGGLSLEETAAALNISLATLKRELRVARAWLAAELMRTSR